MTSKLYIQKRGPAGGADVDYTAFTGRKGIPFFDGDASTIELGHQAFEGQASQGTLRLMDPDAELPRSDFNYNLPAHALVTWTEDGPGAETWLTRGRIASSDSGRGIVTVDNEVEYDTTVDDGNIELRGQAFAVAWARPEETDYERLVALQAHTLNGASSTTSNHRDTCEITVDDSHLAPDANTVTMPAKKYLAGTQPQDVVQDCADTAGKYYAVVIHHAGGSHLCLHYTLETDHATYASAAKISDNLADWDPTDGSAPVWEPHWEQGKATLADGQQLLSGLVISYAPEDFTYAEFATNIESYDYWVESYHDSRSSTSGQSAYRGAGILEKRRLTHITHRVSVIVEPEQVDLIAAGMSIQIKAAAALGGQYLDIYQTRRIGELRWEPRLDGRYWAHMQLDRPTMKKGASTGGFGPQAPVQSVPEEIVGATSDFLWTFADNEKDTTDTYPVGTLATNWHAGYVHTHVTNPGVGNRSAGTKPPITPGTYHFRASFHRNSGTPYNPGGIYMTVYSVDGGIDTLIGTTSTTTSDSSFEETIDVVVPAGGDEITFELPFNSSTIEEVEISHGGGTAVPAFEGTAPPPAASDGVGSVGSSPVYSPSDHQHPVQTATDTPIADAGGFFDGTNVEEALTELAEGGAILQDAGHWETIVSGSSPPVAVTNEASTDWIVGWVPGT